MLHWLPSWRLVTGTSILLTLAMVSGLMIAYSVTKVPDVRPGIDAQTTTIMYSDNSQLTTWSFDAGNRRLLKPYDLPKFVKAAVISAEDRTFYSNKGISPLGIARAAWNDLRGRPLQGGSTITQQYVKNTRVGNERSVSRKVKEFFIAIKIANSMDKDQLLTDYLNTIYFGRHAYGIEAAAKNYFSATAIRDNKRTLTVQQAAYLAGIIDGPNLYDYSPTDSKAVQDKVKARIKVRYDYVLDGMVTLGEINEQQAASFKKALPELVLPGAAKSAAAMDDQTGYLSQMVRAELKQISAATHNPDLAPDKVDTAGYNIHTTFDRKLIQDAVTSVHETLGPRTIKGKPNWPAGTQAGLVSIDPRDGSVKAIYGGDGKRSQNAASQDYVPAGSTFKVFALLAALSGKGDDWSGQDGVSLDSRFSGKSPYRYKVKLEDPKGAKVYNDGNENYGVMDLRKALGKSVNTIFAQLNEEITPKRTQEAAIRAGIPKTNANGDPVVGDEISNTLGNAPVTVYDLASAYGTVANLGVRATPHVIKDIVRLSDNQVMYAFNPSTAKPMFTKEVCADTISALTRPPKSGGTAPYVADEMGRPVAGKTGTVGVKGSRKTRAAWFVGFTGRPDNPTDRQLVTAVTIHRVNLKTGGPDDVEGWGRYKDRDMQGGFFPARLWTAFMKTAFTDVPEAQFPEEAHVGETIGLPPPVETPQPSASPSPSPGDPNASPSPGDPNASPTGNGDPNGNNNGGNPGGGNGDGNGGGNGGQQDGGGQQGNSGANQGGQNPPDQGSPSP